MPKKILQKNEKVLRKIAEEIHVHDIKTSKIKKILKWQPKYLINLTLPQILNWYQKII